MGKSQIRINNQKKIIMMKIKDYEPDQVIQAMGCLADRTPIDLVETLLIVVREVQNKEYYIEQIDAVLDIMQAMMFLDGIRHLKFL